MLQRLHTGVLSSRPTSRDIKIDGFSMGLNGIELIQDCSIELTIGRRYGLIGQNGCGKTNFLQCLANREVSCWLDASPAGSRTPSAALVCRWSAHYLQ
jgi:ATP-binding cassette, subfamily F, member 2